MTARELAGEEAEETEGAETGVGEQIGETAGAGKKGEET